MIVYFHATPPICIVSVALENEFQVLIFNCEIDAKKRRDLIQTLGWVCELLPLEIGNNSHTCWQILFLI